MGCPISPAAAYYGGHYGANNDNHFDLFSASGLDFIAIYMEYDLAANPLVLNWANNLLQTYTNRRAIVVSHYIGRATTPSTFGDQGAAIYNALRTNANLFLMLSGHVAGEGSRVDVFNGNTVQTLVSDYQYYPNGGNGFMRLMQFSPSNSVIRVTTYSPWVDQFETDGDSQFTIPYSMSPSVAASDTNFTALGTNFNVASGSTTGWEWPELAAQSHLRMVRDGDGHLEPHRHRPNLAVHHPAGNRPARSGRGTAPGVANPRL